MLPKQGIITLVGAIGLTFVPRIYKKYRKSEEEQLLTVQKRDGRKVKFDKDKIKIAVLKAFIDVDGEETVYAKEKARDIANYIEALNKSMTVEDIQDQVEERLMASNRKDVARKYIIYRNNRTAIREKNTQLMKDISEKLNANNVQNQNANVDEKSFGGRVGEASDTVLKKYALDNCMSEMARNNHLNNEIYTTLQLYK